MENLTLKLTRAQSSLDGSKIAKNLYLRRVITAAATERAEALYGYSLSELVDHLLEHECQGKKGLLQVLREGKRTERIKGKRVVNRRFTA